jgi:hypothetical protein
MTRGLSRQEDRWDPAPLQPAATCYSSRRTLATAVWPRAPGTRADRHHITSHHITSHHITSHHVTSQHSTAQHSTHPDCTRGPAPGRGHSRRCCTGQRCGRQAGRQTDRYHRSHTAAVQNLPTHSRQRPGTAICAPSITCEGLQPGRWRHSPRPAGTFPAGPACVPAVPEADRPSSTVAREVSFQRKGAARPKDTESAAEEARAGALAVLRLRTGLPTHLAARLPTACQPWVAIRLCVCACLLVRPSVC